MSLTFFKKRKSPEEIAAAVRKDLDALAHALEVGATEEKAVEKLREDIEKRVIVMKHMVYGDPDAKDKEAGGEGSGEPDPVAVEALARAFEALEIMPSMLTHLTIVDFEVRKAVAALFCYFLKNDVAGFASSYLPRHTSVLYQLVDGYSSPEVALNCGLMVRECVRGFPALHEALLYGPDGGLSKPLRALLEVYVHDPNFEVASDAFDTLSVLLTSNKRLVFAALDPNSDAAALARYNELFSLYARLLTSDNYVLKRQSLKLLSEFLLDRENFALMIRYISDKANLKVIMGLLRHKQPNIQFEAFHVFKVFVANPEKPADIAEILAANKAKLVAFLQSFQNEKDDEQFIEEKAMLIDTLNRLPDVTFPAPAPAAPAPAPVAPSA